MPRAQKCASAEGPPSRALGYDPGVPRLRNKVLTPGATLWFRGPSERWNLERRQVNLGREQETGCQHAGQSGWYRVAPGKECSLEGESRPLALTEGRRVPDKKQQLHTQKAGEGLGPAGRCRGSRG